MNRTQSKGLLDALGVLAVVASLLFLAYEIRQNTVAARAAAYQAIGIATASAFDSKAHDPEYLMLELKPADKMNVIEWSQYAAKMTVLARLGETVLLQVEQGLLPVDAMQRLGYSGWTTILQYPKGACVWLLIRPEVSNSFREFVESAQEANTIDCSSFDMPNWERFE